MAKPITRLTIYLRKLDPRDQEIAQFFSGKTHRAKVDLLRSMLHEGHVSLVKGQQRKPGPPAKVTPKAQPAKPPSPTLEDLDDFQPWKRRPRP